VIEQGYLEREREKIPWSEIGDGWMDGWMVNSNLVCKIPTITPTASKAISDIH